MKTDYTLPQKRKQPAIARLRILPVFIFLLIISFSTSSCRKETDCHATITVVDSLDNPLSNIAVKIKAGVIDEEQQSDGSGKSRFTLTYPAITEIWLNGNDTHQTIRFEEGKSTEKTIRL